MEKSYMAEVDNVGQEWEGNLFVFWGSPPLFKMADNGSPYFQISRIDSLLIIIVVFMFIFSPQDVKLEETS
jgi:hypothetical protein